MVKVVAKKHSISDYASYGLILLFLVFVVIYLYDWLSGGLGGTLISTWCTPYSGFYCNNPSLTDNGLLSVTIGQNLGSTQYNVSIACFSQSGLPNQLPSAPEYIDLKSLTQTSNTVQSGKTIQITGLQCYNPNGTAFSGPAGTVFYGQIWLNYSLIGVRVPEKLATFSVKIR